MPKPKVIQWMHKERDALLFYDQANLLLLINMDPCSQPRHSSVRDNYQQEFPH